MERPRYEEELPVLWWLSLGVRGLVWSLVWTLWADLRPSPTFWAAFLILLALGGGLGWALRRWEEELLRWTPLADVLALSLWVVQAHPSAGAGLLLYALLGILLLPLPWDRGTLFLLLALVLPGGLFLARGEQEMLRRYFPAWSGIFFFGTLALLFHEVLHLSRRRQIRRLQRELRGQSQELERLEVLTRVLHELTDSLRLRGNYQRALEDLLRGLWKAVPTEAAGIFLLEEDRFTLRPLVTLGIRRQDQETRIPTEGSPFGQALDRGDSILIPQAEQEPELGRRWPPLNRCGSILLCPIRVQLSSYGVLVVGSPPDVPFEPIHLQLAEIFANLAAVVVENTRLYVQLQEEQKRLLELEEQIRREVAQDLHDGPTQILAAVPMRVQFILGLLEQGQEEAARKELEQVAHIALRGTREIRRIMYELRPMPLEAGSLSEALQQLVQTFHSQEGPHIHLEVDPEVDGALSPERAGNLFSILQEALNNARKHAQARNIWIRVQRLAGEIRAEVEDDGKGFDQAEIRAAYHTRGSYGLKGMEERVERIGGTLQIDSTPGQGTRVQICIPLAEAGAEAACRS